MANPCSLSVPVCHPQHGEGVPQAPPCPGVVPGVLSPPGTVHKTHQDASRDLQPCLLLLLLAPVP